MDVIKNPITGRDKLVVTDEGVFDAITGRQVGIIENGVVKSVTTGMPMAVVVAGEGGTIDLSFITATASDIIAGKVGADSSGNPVYGSISEKAAATYTPGTSDQTIAAGTYLSGKQTIKGDADLKAANIKKGVQIFNVTGSYEGEGGTFGLAKVTEFSPATQAFSGLSQIVISGLGDAYDTANGTYAVTAETEKETDPFKRIYKHPSGEWYFWGEYNSEYEEGYFYIGPAENSGSLVCWTNEEFTDGEYYFEDWDLGDSFEVTLDVTSTNYPATNMVLKGVMATGYAYGEWSFADTEISFTGYENTPKVGSIYAVSGDKLIGNYVSVVSSYSADGNTILMLNFNGNDVLADSSNYAHAVTQEDGAVLPGGYAGNAWNFNGGFLKIEPKGSEFIFGTNDFTIEAYICPTSDRRQCLFAYWDDGVFAICFSYDGDRRFGIFGAAHGWNNRNVTDTLELNKWYHIAFVRRGNILRCFIDGKSTGYSVDMTGTNIGRQQAVGFGRWGGDPGDFDARWQGYMDDIRISNIARYEP